MRVQSFLNATCTIVTLATLGSPTPARAEAAPCAEPTIEVTSQLGGQLQFKIKSPCRKHEFVFARYGKLVIIEKFDGNGNLAFKLDCIFGDVEVDLKFLDDRRGGGHFCSAVETGLTKVAIVWRDRVDLDLRAAEYAASPGSNYHRSAQNPGSYETARLEHSRSGRSHGYMSTVSNGQYLGHNVEVYTLLHHPAEPRGMIAMAIGLVSQENAASRQSCGESHRVPIRVEVDVHILERGTKLRSYEREFAAQPCVGRPTGIVTNLIPSILVGNPFPGGTASAK